MSVRGSVGSDRNLFDETAEHARQLVIDNPILLDRELEQLRRVESEVFKSWTIDTTFATADGPDGLERAVARTCAEANVALAAGANILILSDRSAGPERVPIPSLLATGAVHHHLVREGTRLQAGIVVESGEPRSVHSIAVLIGYGAAAVNPYLMLETLAELVELGWLPPGMTGEQAQRRAAKGIAKGLLKTMSKMGISTMPSYCGAQIFEAVGLAPELVERHFTGTASRIGGMGIRGLAEESLARHARAHPGSADALLPVLGLYAWRRDGEHHHWNPETISRLQHAVRSNSAETYEAYSAAVNAESARRTTLRGSFRFRETEPIPLEAVEPAAEDLKQLIYDLRCANPDARVSVKLVAEVGVGTVAAGVAKAGADHVLISGHDGGTGAAPLSSILYAGVPWEIGLAETQQTLVRNGLRSRIWVQTDGQLKTGRDVVIAALLGADEMGFATAPLVASGCVMMRACHLNTCPVGIATQDPELRAKFAGKPEHVVNFFFFVAR